MSILIQAIAATREAGALTLQYFGGPLEVAYKDRNDPLTAADLQADAYLKKALRDLRPDCGWLSEETVDDRQRLAKEAVWIVDPIDGTREFVEGIPEYVVAVALVEGGEPTLAVIYNPAQDEIFAAVTGGGTFRNGPARVLQARSNPSTKPRPSSAAARPNAVKLTLFARTSAKFARSAASPTSWP